MKKRRIMVNCGTCGASLERRPSDFKHPAQVSYCNPKCATVALTTIRMEAKKRKARSKRVVPQQPKKYRLIGLGGDNFAEVDIKDFKWLDTSIWRMNTGGYATRDGNPRRMHRAIAAKILGRSLARNEQVDHADGNRLNNRRANLRVVTNQQNGFNKKPYIGTSHYKGVFWNKQKGKWAAALSLTESNAKRKYHVGFFAQELDAALAYDVAAIQLFGQHAYLNLIGR